MSGNLGLVNYIEIAAERIAEDILKNPACLEYVILGKKYCTDYCAGQVRIQLSKKGIFHANIRTASEKNGTKEGVYNLDDILDRMMPSREIPISSPRDS
jgi:hypothetical protein